MEKKIALALISLLVLTFILSTPFYLQNTTVEAQYPPWHWKIELAQKKCNVWIDEGYLTYQGDPIIGTEFELLCIFEELPPHTQRVFVKVETPVIPTDIHFVKYIDWNLDGLWDVVEPVDLVLSPEPESHRWLHHQQDLWLNLQAAFPPIPLDAPICTEWKELDPIPGRLYHLSSWEDAGYPYGELSYCDQVDLTPIEPPGPLDWWHVVEATPTNLLLNKLMCVEVHEQPYDPDFPVFQWQLKMKQHGLKAQAIGYLTENGDPISGTDFDVICADTLQVVVVPTPWCTVPNDIHIELFIDGVPGSIIIDEIITQFPWKYYYGTAGADVTLELTEVQMHPYWVMIGWLNSAGRLSALPPWNLSGWMYGDGVPFATRSPDAMPKLDKQDVTFTQKDPITGIVELFVPAESYIGLDHMWYSYDQGTWFRARIVLEDAGCGWIFTGEGKEPILGSVDLLTYNSYTGVYTYGPDLVPGTLDDELLAGEVSGGGSAGAGPPIGPCLQLLRGPDGVAGTGDDPIGRGDPDGPNPPGSSIVYLPTTMYVTYWNDALKRWDPLFSSPWPQLLTTGTAQDTVIEPLTAINGATSTQTGQPWEFYAGLDHPGWKVNWKHPKCNAYVSYVSVWSVLHTSSSLGNVDVLSEVKTKWVRDDCVIADVNGDEKVTITDIVIAALAFGAQDEYIGPDGIPNTADDKRVADPSYSARGDFAPTRGKITITDIVTIALDFGSKLTPDCIITT